MKKILMSILVIGVSLGMLGAGTFSYFSDEEIAMGNTFSAGTIDIQIGDNDPWTGSFQLEEAKPCEVRYIEFDIENVGLNPCVIWKHIEITAEIGGEHPEPEEAVDPGDTINDISNWIMYDLVVDDVVIFYEDDGYTLGDIACMWMPLGTLQPGAIMHVKQSYHLDPETGNAYQGDIVTFDIELFAEQRLGPGPTQRSNKLFLDNKDETDWYFIVDHIWGVLDWTDGANQADLFATGLQDVEYSLITYEEPWPGTCTLLASGTATDGNLTITDFDMSAISPYTGKIWLVLSSDYSVDHMISWHADDYLFESNIATI